jgi:pimeloyl-ACP methyl ester carboxylesterase
MASCPDHRSAGVGFVQVTAQSSAELARNTGRIVEMEAFEVPARNICGENDPYTNVDVAWEFQLHLKYSSLNLPPAGHWVPLDERALVAQAMLS